MFIFRSTHDEVVEQLKKEKEGRKKDGRLLGRNYRAAIRQGAELMAERDEARANGSAKRVTKVIEAYNLNLVALSKKDEEIRSLKEALKKEKALRRNTP